MKDSLITEMQALTRAIGQMVAEQRETNSLIRELLELEAGEGGSDGPDVPETQGMGTTIGSIVKRS